MSNGTIQAAIEFAGILESLGVRYMIGGSMASTVWGEPRFTQDVDFVAALSAHHIADLLGALGDEWYADESMLRAAIGARSSFNLIRFEGMVKVDVFVPPDEGFHASKWNRVRRAALSTDGGPELAITSPEDILLQKLDWYRKGGEVSEQQWRDVTALLRIRKDLLDDAYLDEWAKELDLADLLCRARADA